MDEANNKLFFLEYKDYPYEMNIDFITPDGKPYRSVNTDQYPQLWWFLEVHKDHIADYVTLEDARAGSDTYLCFKNWTFI